MGPRAALPLKRRSSRSAATLAPPLQQRQKPQRDRQPAAHHPRSQPAEAEQLERRDAPGADALGHLRRLLAVDLAVLELEDRQLLLAAELLDARALALAEAVLDDLVLDTLLVERLLHAPARVEVGVQERPRAAMELDLGHGAHPIRDELLH